MQGREDEVATIEEALSAATTAGAHIVVVEGEPGSGKSTLLDAFLDRARAAGYATLDAAADPFERNVPFAPLRRALAGNEDSFRPLVRPDGLPPSRAGPHHLAVLEAVLNEIEDRAGGGPLAIALDDLQWADEGTLVLVPKLVGRARNLPVVVLGAWRNVPVRVELQLLASRMRRATDHRIVLGPLPASAVAALARAEVGAEVGERLLREVGRAGGNPLLVLELLRSLARTGALERRAGVVDVAHPLAGAKVDAVVRGRIADLDDDTVDVLHVAAVLGPAFHVADVAALLGRTVVSLRRVVMEAVGAGILVPSNEHLRFSHDVLRAALYDELPRPLRNGIHVEAGRLLARGGALGAAAQHFAIGGRVGDRQAIAIMREAARAPGAAPGAVIELLDRALALVPSGDPLRYELLAEQVVPMMLAGAAGKSERTTDLVISALPGPVEQAPMRAARARLLVSLGRAAEARDELDAAVDHLDELARARLLADGVVIRLVTMDRAGAERDGAEAIEAGRRLRRPDIVATAQAGLALAAMTECRARRSSALATGAAQALGSGPHTIRPRVFGALALLHDDASASAAHQLALAERDAALAPNELPLVHTVLANLRFTMGDWDAAMAEAEAAISLADEVESHVSTTWAWTLLATIALRRREDDAAKTALAQIDRLQASGDGLGIGAHSVAVVRALHAEASGAPLEAIEQLEVMLRTLVDVGMPFGLRLVVPELSRIAAAAGVRHRARPGIEALAAAIGDEQSASLQAELLISRGRLDGDADVLLEAARHFARAGRPYERAVALGDAAIAVAARDTTRAGELGGEALSALQSWDAQRDTEWLSVTLRRAGVRIPRPRRRRPHHGWASLTPVEGQVVVLLCRGLSNPDIGTELGISRRTVAAHLSNVYRKVGVTTRLELVAKARDESSSPS